jgi:hypothetical protein
VISVAIFSMVGHSPGQIADWANGRQLACYEISTLDGSDITEFFDSARSRLPLDPPVVSNNWGAFIDSLDSGIADVEMAGVVILWPDASHLQRGSPEDFEIAMSCLARVGEHVQNPAWTPSPKSLSVFVDIEPVTHRRGRGWFQVRPGGEVLGPA